MGNVEWDSRGENVKDYWAGIEVKSGTAVTAGIEVGSITVPENSIVDRVIAIVKTAAVGGTACTISAGPDASNKETYLVASDWKAAADTAYGDALAEIGTSLKVATGASSGYAPMGVFIAAGGYIKVYSIVTVAVNTTEGVAMVYAHILKVEGL